MTAQVCLFQNVGEYIASCVVQQPSLLFFILSCYIQPFFCVLKEGMKALSCSITSQFMGRLLLIMSILKRPRQESFWNAPCLFLSPSSPTNNLKFFIHIKTALRAE